MCVSYSRVFAERAAGKVHRYIRKNEHGYDNLAGGSIEVESGLNNHLGIDG